MNNWMTSDNDNNDDGGDGGGKSIGLWDPNHASIYKQCAKRIVYEIKT